MHDAQFMPPQVLAVHKAQWMPLQVLTAHDAQWMPLQVLAVHYAQWMPLQVLAAHDAQWMPLQVVALSINCNCTNINLYKNIINECCIKNLTPAFCPKWTYQSVLRATTTSIFIIYKYLRIYIHIYTELYRLFRVHRKFVLNRDMLKSLIKLT